MNPAHDPMTYPLPRLKSFTLCAHHMDEHGTHIRMITFNEAKVSIIRFMINGHAGSYGAEGGLYEVMYTGGDDVKGYCDMSEVSAIIYSMSDACPTS
jgi:hypothetical protein